MKRSLSDGNIHCISNSPVEDANAEWNQDSDKTLLDKTQSGNKASESPPEISTGERFESDYSEFLYNLTKSS